MSPPDRNERTAGEAELRPIEVCRALLEALDAAEGRRRRRKRNTSADAIGIGMKRMLLEAALRDDPDVAAFEGWLLERCFEQGPGEGAWRAMALEIFGEWRMARAAPSFRDWLEAGAPSDDKRAGRPHVGARDGRAAPGFGGRGLPVLGLVALLTAGGPVACERGIEADVEDVPEIEVEALSSEARQGAGQTAWVLTPLLAGPGPASTVYDPPVNLARPPEAAVWPPGTGTVGDSVVGAAPADTADPAAGRDQSPGSPSASSRDAVEPDSSIR